MKTKFGNERYCSKETIHLIYTPTTYTQLNVPASCWECPVALRLSSPALCREQGLPSLFIRAALQRRHEGSQCHGLFQELEHTEPTRDTKFTAIIGKLQ